MKAQKKMWLVVFGNNETVNVFNQNKNGLFPVLKIDVVKVIKGFIESGSESPKWKTEKK